MVFSAQVVFGRKQRAIGLSSQCVIARGRADD